MAAAITILASGSPSAGGPVSRARVSSRTSYHLRICRSWKLAGGAAAGMGSSGAKQKMQQYEKNKIIVAPSQQLAQGPDYCCNEYPKKETIVDHARQSSSQQRGCHDVLRRSGEHRKLFRGSRATQLLEGRGEPADRAPRDCNRREAVDPDDSHGRPDPGGTRALRAVRTDRR